ncbi:MAG: hypothetical protein EOP81_08170 [Variovorax sp.]|nr:MAG: hypothetical protein EOP81_08170 [Variovorax sp.]
MKRRTFAATGLTLTLAALAALPAQARSVPPPASQRIGALAQVSVVDRASGRELPVYRHRGEYWVAGSPGARYAIRLRNASGERVMAVMSVDGVNVVTGETASFAQNGYVFDGRERADIAGWRKSDAQIAAFEFTSLADSYAGRTGRPDHVGVIGVALFRERVVAPVAPPPVVSRPGGYAERERRAESTAPAADAAAPASPAAEAADAMRESRSGANASAKSSVQPSRQAPSLGTGHGRRETSHVGRTPFDRAQSAPDEVIRIRYDSHDQLVAAGVIPRPYPTRPTGPSAFPESNAGYVPDPPARY